MIRLSQSRVAIFLAGTVVGAIFAVGALSFVVVGDGTVIEATGVKHSDLPGNEHAERPAMPGPSEDVAVSTLPSIRGRTIEGEQSAASRANESGASHSRDVQRKPPARQRVPIPVSEAHKAFLRSEDRGGRTTLHGRLEREPEDAAWSYFTEQSLGQFIGQHEKAALFSVFNIECRTTMCEIQVVGYDDSTSPDWSRILYDLEQQPWYDFGQVGTSLADYQGQLALVTHLVRRDYLSGE